MPSYSDNGRDSGISSYETTPDSITIRFKDGSTYLYNHATTGKSHVEYMKSIAATGQGLNEFINRFVRELYNIKLEGPSPANPAAGASPPSEG